MAQPEALLDTDTLSAIMRGHPLVSMRTRGDADILIGASALAHGLAVVTNNEDHFRRIPGLHVENWLRP